MWANRITWRWFAWQPVFRPDLCHLWEFYTRCAISTSLKKVPNSKFDVTLIPKTTPKINTYHMWRVATWSTWRTHLASKCRCTLHSAQAIPYTDQSLRAAAQFSAIWCHVSPVQHSTALSPTHSLRPCCLPGIPQGAPVHQHTHSFNGMRVFP